MAPTAKEIAKSSMVPDKNRPKSYAAWLYGKGLSTGETDEKYREDVENANKSYESSLPTYGAKAESLAKDGLSSSGYSAYLSSLAKSRLESDLNDAGQGLAERSEKQMASYRSYLAGFRNKQEKLAAELKEKIIEDRVFDPDYAYQIAISAGLGEEYARSVAEYGSTVAKERTREEATAYAIENGMDSTEAYHYARARGLSDPDALRIAEAASTYLESRKKLSDRLAEMTPAEYLEYLRSLNKITLETTESEKKR